MRPDGEVVEIDARRDPDLMAAARLGSLGLITRVTMRVVPAYHRVARHVWLMPLAQVLTGALELARRHRHFEFYVLPFTGYAAAIPPGPLPRLGSTCPTRLTRTCSAISAVAMTGWAVSLACAAGQPALIDPQLTESARHRSHRLWCPRCVPPVFRKPSGMCRVSGLACLRAVVDRLEQHNEAFFPLEFHQSRATGPGSAPSMAGNCSIAVHAAADEAWDYLIDDFTPIFRAHQGRQVLN